MGNTIPSTNASSDDEIVLGDEVTEHIDAQRSPSIEEVVQPIPSHHVINDISDEIHQNVHGQRRNDRPAQNQNEELEGIRAENIRLNVNEFIPRALIEVMPGQRDNSEIYVVNGTYVFHRDWSVLGTLKCSQRTSLGCPACIRITREGEFLLECDHNGHSEKGEVLELIRTKEFVAQQALNTNLKPAEIYKQVVETRRAAQEQFSESACYSLVDRTRKKNRPVISNDLQNLSQLLEEYQFSRDMYKGEIEHNQKRAFFFADNQVMDELNRSQHIHVSSSIKVRCMIFDSV